MQPAPFKLEKPIDEMYKDFTELWMTQYGRLPNEKDFLVSWEELVKIHKSFNYDPQWLEALDFYFNSDKPEHRYFASFTLGHDATLY